MKHLQRKKRVNALKTIEECKTELERCGGIQFCPKTQKIIPKSAKANHIVNRLFEITHRHDPKVWEFLADEADWKARVGSVAQAAKVFETPMEYRVPNRSPYGTPVNRGASRGDRQVDRFTGRRKTLVG